MVEYRYYAHDDDGRIVDREFNNFADAFDYCQKGLITFITEIPYVDGVEDEENEEVVWTWDNTWDRDEAIAEVEARHNDAAVVESVEDDKDDDFWLTLEDIQADPVEIREISIPDDNQAISDFDTEFPDVEEVDEDLIADKAPASDKEVKLRQRRVSVIHKDGAKEHVPGSVVEQPLDEEKLVAGLSKALSKIED